jgi:hypothetical protein
MAYSTEERGNFTQLERLVYDLLQAIGSSGGSGSGSGAPGFNMNLLLDCCENNKDSMQDLVSQSAGVNSRLDTLIASNSNQLDDIGVFINQAKDSMEFNINEVNASIANIRLPLDDIINKIIQQTTILAAIKSQLEPIRRRGVFLAEGSAEGSSVDLTVTKFKNLTEENGEFYVNAYGNQKQVENVEVVYLGGSYMFKILYSYS